METIFEVEVIDEEKSIIVSKRYRVKAGNASEAAERFRKNGFLVLGAFEEGDQQ